MAAGADGRGDRADLLAGGVMMAIGALGLWAGRSLAFGTPATMGPGFMPRVMCVLLVAIGAFVLVKGLAKPAEGLGLVNLKPLAILVVAIAGFAFAGERLGFALATAFLIVVGSLADEESRWREIALSTVILTAAGAVVFIEGLGVQMPLWPSP
jgi:hypothetical protein